MREDSLSNLVMGHATDDRHLQHTHDLTALNAEHGRPEQQSCLRIDHGFDQASSFIGFNRPGHPSHWQAKHQHVASAGSGLGFVESNPGEWRVGEHRVRHEPVRGAAGRAVQQPVSNDAVIVVGDVREGRTTFDITERVNALNARWMGQIQPNYTGEWTFSMQADDGIRLYVNNQLVIDHWAPSQLGPEYTGKISLTAGQKYDLKLEFYEGGGGAGVLLRWAHQYQPIEVVPTTQLYPAVAAIPKWTLNPTSLEFNGTVGSTPASKTFTITNTGGVHAVFGMGSSNNSLVTATGYSPSLAVGASTTATVIVGQCTAVGTTTGQLAVDGGGSNATVAITRVCGDQPTTPPPPTTLSSITMSSKGRILISWPEVTNATQYDFQAKFDGAAIGVSGQAPNRGGANGAAVATFISNADAADKQGKEICFSIRANNAGGSSGFSDFACTTYKYYAAGLTVQSATDIPQLTLK